MVRVGKYKWDITDEYGWDIDQCASRDIKISDILSEKTKSKILYKLYLHRPIYSTISEMNVCMVWFSEHNQSISFNSQGTSNDISVKFRCSSLVEAIQFVELVCDGNNLVVMPKFINS